MADQESDIFRSLFGDIIQSYDVYDFISVGELSVHAFAYSIEEYEKFLKQWIPSSSERYDNNKAQFS
jgi:Lrp/AsnC family leucine-responsive transcriptional regulator